MKKTIKLNGRIDSSNSADIEKNIMAELSGWDGGVEIDAEKLDYISSAGLRVILRIKKTFPDTEVINCTPEVYEIFDMTGFTEMMDISKSYRVISVEGCEVIGEGANGKVYRTDPDTIVKVYKDSNALEEIKNERELARKAFVLGIPTAIPYDVVRVGDTYGSVFELLNADSFANLLINGKANAEEIASQCVDILKIIHNTFLSPGELPDKKAETMKWALFAKDYLPDEIGDKLVSLFESVPDTNNMIHGDFHLKNIMKQNGENLLIDMDTLAMGHPIYEFAAMHMAYNGYSCVNRNNVTLFLGITREQADIIWEGMLKGYFADKDEEFLKQIEIKCGIISYARIMRAFIRSGNTDEFTQQHIDFCKNFLIENVPAVDSLAY